MQKMHIALKAYLWRNEKEVRKEMANDRDFNKTDVGDNTAGCGNCVEEDDSVKHLDYEEEGHELRALIKDVGRRVKDYIGHSKAVMTSIGVDRGEMIANATLSYRHMESAAMRVGKSMQAYQGGVSILDKMRAKTTKGEGLPK